MSNSPISKNKENARPF